MTRDIAIFFKKLTAAMEAPDFDMNALENSLPGIDASDCRAAGGDNVHNNVIEQEPESILDYFDEDDLDFVDSDWDRLEVNPRVELATPASIPDSADWRIDDLDQLLEQLPTTPVEPTYRCLPASFVPAFDTQSVRDFYHQGSSSPQRPEQTPTQDQTNRRHSDHSDNELTPTPVDPVLSKPSVWKIIRHVRSREPNWMSKSDVTAVRRTITEKTGIVPKPWQVSVMLDAVYTQKDVVVLAGTGSGRSLPYQFIPFIKENAIVLVILPTIALMNDQVRSTICPVTDQ